MILLHNNLLFSKGSERACYIHPEDNKKVIKVIYHKKGNNNQNNLEFKYYQYLSKKDIEYTHITKCYGWVDTNIGKGLVFDRIVNYNGLTSKQLTYFLQNKLLSNSIEKQLIKELKQYLDKNNILFIDIATLNVLCQEVEDSKYRLVIIDGLGPKRDNLKFWIYKYSRLYCRYKNYKQWNKFLKLIEKNKNIL